MPAIPLDEGAAGRRRAGPFWIEEGGRLLWVGAGIVALVLVLYTVAIILDGA